MTLEELKSKIAEVLEIKVSEIQEDSSPGTIERWDSMGTLGIISILDDALEGGINADDVAGLTSFAAIVEYARNQGIISD